MNKAASVAPATSDGTAAQREAVGASKAKVGPARIVQPIASEALVRGTDDRPAKAAAAEEDEADASMVLPIDRDSAPSCMICYERFSSGSVPCDACPKHPRAFCTPCLIRHVRFAISNNILPVQCPLAPTCDTVVDAQKVHAILCGCNAPVFQEYNDLCKAKRARRTDIAEPLGAASTCCNKEFEQYLRQRDLKKNPSLHTCPACSALCQPPASGITNIQCQTCNLVFCSIHGNVHQGMSCAEYEASRPLEAKEADALSAKVIEETSKPCPHCHTRIFHAGGCNHVICKHCEKDFCFGCGSAEFLEGRMFRTCTKCNAHFFDHRYECEMRARICLSVPIWLPCLLGWMAIYITCFVGSLACCCLCCGKLAQLFVEDDRGVGAKVTVPDVIRCILQPCCGPLINILLFFGRCGQCLVRPLLSKNQLMEMGLEPQINEQDNEVDLEIGSASKSIVI